MIPDREDEYYDGGDPEFDPNEINRQVLQRIATSTTINNTNTEPVDLNRAHKVLEAQYNNNKTSSSKSTSASEEENPLSKFNRIQSEIAKIEADINFYKANEQAFKGEVSLEKCIDELNKLKLISNYISDSPNFRKLQHILSIKGAKDSNKYNIFNKEIYQKLNEHLLKRLSIINKLKAQNPSEYANIEYELYITPDIEKVKQYSKISEIKQSLSNIEKRIGEWNYGLNKKTLTTVVKDIKNNLRLFDFDFQKEMKGKLENLTQRINEITNGNEEFYNKVNKSKLDELCSGFKDSKDVEELIFSTINKMESLKNSHEQSAFISLKIKDLIEQQEKLDVSIEESGKILDNLKGNIKENALVIQKNLDELEKKLKKK